VAIDSSQVILDRRLIEAGPTQRRLLNERLRANGFARVWAQADRAGEMTELDRARFLLRRLYPDLEGPRLESIMGTLAAEWAAGTWTGFQRPGRASLEGASISGPAVDAARSVSPEGRAQPLSPDGRASDR